MATVYALSGNWGSTSSWSSSSGGASGAAIPTAADAVIFDANSGAVTLNVNGTCLTVDFTNYTNTITWNAQLVINGTGTSCTLGASMSFASGVAIGSALLILFNNLTLTSNGKKFPYTLYVDGVNVTFADDAQCGKFITSGGGAQTLSGTHNLYIDGDFGLSQNLLLGASSTVTIFLRGSGTWSGGAYCYPSITVTGTYAASGTVRLGGPCTLTVLTGTLTMTGTTLEIPASGGTHINAPSTTFNNITVFSNGTLYLDAATTVNGTLSSSGNYVIGSGGATINNLTLGGACTLGHGNTYTVSGLFTATGTSGAHASVTSDDATIKAILTINGTQNVIYCNATRIDSSGGNSVRSVGGVLNNALNWINTVSNFFMFN